MEHLSQYGGGLAPVVSGVVDARYNQHIGSLLLKCEKPRNNAKNGDNPNSDKNLALSLFLDSEIDPNLRLIVERWPELSVEFRQAIVKMVQ